MKKSDELSNTQSCLSKAGQNEMLFVLRGQDASSPKTVLFWIAENFDTCPDAKLREAFECALSMKQTRGIKVAD